jgi:hypothetical protein
MSNQKTHDEELTEARRIMGRLSSMPHKTHRPIKPKPKSSHSKQKPNVDKKGR